jgi:hypothetical protein
MSHGVRTVLREGGGPSPGYKWSIEISGEARKQIAKAFSEAQYWHLVDQMRDLASENDPTHPQAALSVKQIHAFYELRDNGGVLGAVNARIFFGVAKEKKTIVVLGGIAKQNNGPTPQPTVILMSRRLRKYA